MKSFRACDFIYFVIILIVFCIFIWKWYWKLQVMYNSTSLSLYTPKRFKIYRPERYYDLVEKGKIYAKKRRVIIAGLLRDVAERMNLIEKRAESLGKLFQDYRILIVENDSTDNTRKDLLDWSRRNSKVVILGCGRNSKHCTLQLPPSKGHSVYRSRIEKMAHLRNIYLEEVKKEYSDFDYLIVWDMDIIGSVYLDGVANSMGYFSNEDKSLEAICAYGIYQWGPLKLYYDTYATLEKGDSFHIDYKSFHDLKKGLGMQYQRGDSLVDVVSCFSGFTIYRLPIITSSSAVYGTTPKDDPSRDLVCEHVFFHSTIPLKNMYLNPSMIHLVIRNN